SYGLRAGRATRVRLRAHGHDPSNTSVALGSSWRHSASVARTAWEQAHAREVFDPGAVSVQVRHPEPPWRPCPTSGDALQPRHERDAAAAGARALGADLGS